MWEHKRCSGIKARLQVDPNYEYRVCTGFYVHQVEPDPLVLGGVALETVDTYYLGDTLSAGVGAKGVW